jgi:hypothetical protein
MPDDDPLLEFLLLASISDEHEFTTDESKAQDASPEIGLLMLMHPDREFKEAEHELSDLIESAHAADRTHCRR